MGNRWISDDGEVRDLDTWEVLDDGTSDDDDDE